MIATLEAFFATHWGHLLTKPGTALAIAWPLHAFLAWILWLPDVVVWAVPLALGVGVQEAVSIANKYAKWPHHMRTPLALGWKDVWADTVAATAGVMWLWPGFGWQWGVAWAALVAVVLVAGLHKWALP